MLLQAPQHSVELFLVTVSLLKTGTNPRAAIIGCTKRVSPNTISGPRDPALSKATKFSFLLALEPGHRPGSACSVTQADEEARVLRVPPSRKKEQNKGAGGNVQGLSRLLLRCGAYYIRSHAIDQ